MNYTKTANVSSKILTIIVPAYNMEWCLEKNLMTYVSPLLEKKLSVIVLDNSSSDNTFNIAKNFEEKYPAVFKAIKKENNGYGSSVNLGMSLADGKFFRVIDADDCADTDALIKFVEHLSHCYSDVVQTPYSIIDIKTGDSKRINLDTDFEKTQPIIYAEKQAPFPSLHTTTLRTDFYQKHRFTLLENAYYVDEEWSIYPFFNAETICAYDDAVYCYHINNDGQSISVKNKVKNLMHRDRIVKQMMQLYDGSALEPDNARFCFRRIARTVGDHFTTLYILHDDKKEGRRIAKEFLAYVKENHFPFYCAVRKKRFLLSVLNRLHVGIPIYERLKKFFGYKEHSSIC